MNVALMGSVSSSWCALDALIEGGVEVTGVLGVAESRAAAICDYRSLRGRCHEAGLPYHAFRKVREPGVREFLEGHAPDLLWVIGLSQLVPDSLIGMARHGAVGFHPTLLPEGRGRAPVAWTILRGKRAAANLFYLVDEADAGDIIVQREVPVLPHDYAEDLIRRTNATLRDAILELAPAIRTGRLPRTPQDHSRATVWPRRGPEDGEVDWNRSCDAIYRLVRAAGRPYHGAFSQMGQDRLIVWRARPESRSGDAAPGEVLEVTQAGPLIACAEGALRLIEVQWPAGAATSCWVRGARLGRSASLAGVAS